jgi:hypothetical protein
MRMKTTKMSFLRKQESRIFKHHIFTLSLCLSFTSLFFFTLHSLAFAEEKIHVFPTTPVDVYAIYTSLAIFWLAIIGLIVVIKMKLNEIERIQKLGIDREDYNAPMLD